MELGQSARDAALQLDAIGWLSYTRKQRHESEYGWQMIHSESRGRYRKGSPNIRGLTVRDADLSDQ